VAGDSVVGSLPPGDGWIRYLQFRFAISLISMASFTLCDIGIFKKQLSFVLFRQSQLQNRSVDDSSRSLLINLANE
jgi:hypothetical protein